METGFATLGTSSSSSEEIPEALSSDSSDSASLRTPESSPELVSNGGG